MNFTTLRISLSVTSVPGSAEIVAAGVEEEHVAVAQQQLAARLLSSTMRESMPRSRPERDAAGHVGL